MRRWESPDGSSAAVRGAGGGVPGGENPMRDLEGVELAQALSFGMESLQYLGEACRQLGREGRASGHAPAPGRAAKGDARSAPRSSERLRGLLARAIGRRRRTAQLSAHHEQRGRGDGHDPDNKIQDNRYTCKMYDDGNPTHMNEREAHDDGNSERRQGADGTEEGVKVSTGRPLAGWQVM